MKIPKKPPVGRDKEGIHTGVHTTLLSRSAVKPVY
jgi:hypothetical protein